MQGSPGASLSDATTQLGPATGRVRRIGVLAAVAAAIYLLDVLSKVVVVAALSDRAPVELAGGLLTLRVTRNPGAAFSIGVGMTVLFTLIAVMVVAVIIRTASRLYSLSWAIALGMLLGGALGNLTDRVFRSPGILRGQVVDFLELPNWPIFNVADSAIVSAGVLMVLLSLLGVPLEGRPAATAQESGAREPGAAPGPAGHRDPAAPEPAIDAHQARAADPATASDSARVPDPASASDPDAPPIPPRAADPVTAADPATASDPATPADRLAD